MILSVTEYNFIKLLYEKFEKMSIYISSLIRSNEWDSVAYALKDKDNLIKQIMTFEKIHYEAVKNNEELMKIRKNLIDLEKKNIELVKLMKEELKSEITAVNNSKKFLNTYEPSSMIQMSTINVTDEDD